MIIKDRKVLLRCHNSIRNAAIRGDLIYGRTLITAAPVIGEEVNSASFTTTDSPVSFEDKRVPLMVGRVSMMLKVFLHRLLCDVAYAPRPVLDGTEAPPLVSLAQGRVFFLEPPARASLHPLDHVGQCPTRRVLNVDVDLVFAHHTFEDGTFSLRLSSDSFAIWLRQQP
jgi:hypothetical protein